MPGECIRCGSINPEVARFCRICGLALQTVDGSPPQPGRVPHPEPLPPPAGYAAIVHAPNLYFAWAATGGGRPLLGTEPLVLTMFNGGYGLAQVALVVRGVDPAGRQLFAVQREIDIWRRGQTVQLEIPSWELPDPVATLHVELVSAGFGSQD